MNPKKAKELIPQVAKVTGLSEQTIKDVTTYYWQEIRKSLSSLKHGRIHVTNLGDFVTKHWKIENKILGLEKFEEKNKLKGMQEMTARFKTAESLYDLKNLQKHLEEEKHRENTIKLTLKKNYELKKQHHKNLED